MQRRVAGALAETLRCQQELGVEQLSPDLARRLLAAATPAPAPAPAPAPEVPAPDAPPARSARPVQPASPAKRPAEAPQTRRSSDTRRPASGPAPTERPPWAAQDREGRTLGIGSPALLEVRKALGPCQRCALGERRSNLVFGVGNPNARLMFIGEAPGAEEDRRGEPFVGAAGQLLTKMLGAMRLRREDVYIANVVKCRPPGNRNPKPEEVAQCLPFLAQQVAAIRPECLVALGGVAASSLLGRPVAVLRERGEWTTFEGVPLMLTLHPAYLLRQPAAKRDAWTDLQAVMQRLGL